MSQEMVDKELALILGICSYLPLIQERLFSETGLPQWMFREALTEGAEDGRWEVAQVAVHDGSRSFLCSEMNFRQIQFSETGEGIKRAGALAPALE